MTLVLHSSIRWVLLLLLITPTFRVVTTQLPNSLTIGLLLPESGTYSYRTYKTVCVAAINAMHKKKILDGTQIE